jgi:hypothetical protein
MFLDARRLAASTPRSTASASFGVDWAGNVGYGFWQGRKDIVLVTFIYCEGQLVATTDVLFGDVRHVKGTEFEIVSEPKAGQVPVQVDQATASRWLRDDWAKAKPSKDKASS